MDHRTLFNNKDVLKSLNKWDISLSQPFQLVLNNKRLITGEFTRLSNEHYLTTTTLNQQDITNKQEIIWIINTLNLETNKSMISNWKIH